MIDLHTHSTASDGAYSPTDLVEAASRIGLHALALTDHDGAGGLDEAIAAARRCRLTFIPGIEISAELEGGTLHIVGLHIDHREPGLVDTVAWMVRVRNERNAIIAERLTELGLPTRIEDVAALTPGEVVGRPHFARLMIQRGYVRDLGEAFRRFLGVRGSAYVPKQRLAPARAIEVIRQAGGVPVLAHPDQTKRSGADLEELVRELRDLGLAGIEAYCSGYSQHRARTLRRLADRFGLVLSGGSDFHGEIVPTAGLGRGTGKLAAPDKLLAPLAEAARTIREENSAR